MNTELNGASETIDVIPAGDDVVLDLPDEQQPKRRYVRKAKTDAVPSEAGESLLDQAAKLEAQAAELREQATAKDRARRDELVSELAAIEARLGDATTAKPKPVRITRGPKRQSKAVGRSRPIANTGSDVVSIIAKAGKDGAKSADIQSALGLTRDKARLAVQAAIEAGKVKAKGKARGMRYFAAVVASIGWRDRSGRVSGHWGVRWL